MSKKIIGVTVGTPTSPAKIAERIKPVRTINGKKPDENGNVEMESLQGKPGADGKNGADGQTPYIKNGYWYIGDVNTNVKAQAVDGKNGADGNDGVGVKSVVQTTSTSADGGANVITVTLSDGTKSTFTVYNGNKGSAGKDGSDGKDGNGIKSAVLNADYTLKLTFSDGTSYTTPSIRGAAGANGKDGTNGTNGKDGKGIKSIARTSGTGAAGTTDTYTITYTDNTTSTFTVYNGKNGTSVTVKSVSESAASGGTNTVTFSDGKKINIKNGADGKDYVLTDADRAEMVAMVLEAIGGNPIYGYIDENYHIVLSGNMPDGTYTASYEDENGSIVPLVGQLVKDTNVYYSVTSDLTNCTNSNGTKTVVDGGSYSATITANSGYELKSVVVTMGGSPVSVSGGVINIASVTGNIVITAVAEEVQVSYIQCAYIANSDQNSYVDLGIVNTETTGIQIKYEYVDVSSQLGIVGIMGNADIAIGHPSTADADLRGYWGGVKSFQLMANTAVDTEYLVGVNYCGSGKANINGTDKAWNSGTKTFAKSETITVCKQNGGKNFKKNSLIKIKEVYISEGSSVSKHYVPAYRSTDGAIGMLETNSNTFIPATGTFTKGADV